jgi:hypothetical protein
MTARQSKLECLCLTIFLVFQIFGGKAGPYQIAHAVVRLLALPANETTLRCSNICIGLWPYLVVKYLKVLHYIVRLSALPVGKVLKGGPIYG